MTTEPVVLTGLYKVQKYGRAGGAWRTITINSVDRDWGPE